MQQADSAGAVYSSRFPYREIIPIGFFRLGDSASESSVTKRDLSHKYPYELVKLMWNDWRLASQVRPPFFREWCICNLESDLFLRILLWIQPWKRLVITVYPLNWHATCETVNVFFFMHTIWLSNDGEKPTVRSLTPQ